MIFTDEDGGMRVVEHHHAPLGTVWTLREPDVDSPYATVRLVGIIQLQEHVWEITLAPLTAHAPVISTDIESFCDAYRRQDALEEHFEALRAELGLRG